MARGAVAGKTHGWEVQQGPASEIVSTLAERESEVIVFIPDRGSEKTVRTKVAALREVAGMIDTLIEDRGRQKWDALVEALTPDVPLSRNKVVEAEMLAKARQTILESGEFVKATAIAGAAHFSSKNPSSQPNRWKRGGQIFAVHYKGADLYPLYALEQEQGVRPLPIVASILKHLEDKDDWQKAFWFESLNSYLRDRKPKELLRSRPEDVLRAAELEQAGVQHG